MDVPAGNALPDPYTGSGAAGLSLARPHHRAIPRPASPARPTRPPPPPPRSPPSSAPPTPARLRDRRRDRRSTPARPSGATAASSCTTPISPAPPAASTRSSSARSCAASTSCATAPAPIRSSPRSIALAADVKAVLGPDAKVTYAADWSEYFGHQPADGSRRRPLPSRSAVGRRQHRRRRHRHLLAARRLARRPRPSRLCRPAPLHPRSRLSQRQHRRRRGLRLVLRQRRRPRRADPHADHRRRSASPGSSATRTSASWWSNAALRPAGRHREPHADRAGCRSPSRSGSPSSAAPPSTKAPTSRTSFIDPKSVRKHLPLFLAGASATTSCSGAICRRSSNGSIAGTPALDGAEPGESASTPAAWSIPRASMLYCLGRPALSGLPGHALDLGRRRQLAARPLADRPHLASAPLAETVARHHGAITASTAFDAGQLSRRVAGYVIDRVMSARDALQPLELAFFFDSFESEGQLRLRPSRARRQSAPSLTPDELVETARRRAPLRADARARKPICPTPPRCCSSTASATMSRPSPRAARIAGGAGRISTARLPIVTSYATARTIAETMVQEAWSSRERAPSRCRRRGWRSMPRIWSA